MFTIDKREFGAFVAALRKENGYTQRELAEKMHISDKAVSKWETGASIPDTALLIPLSELLGVSVTELLMCRRVAEEPMETQAVESLVKTAISYSDGRAARAYEKKSVWQALYVLSLLVGLSFCLWGTLRGEAAESVLFSVVFGALFGAYFAFLVPLRLPEYYDSGRLGAFSDGALRLNLPGIRISNRNWPYLVRVGRVWALLSMTAYPLLFTLLDALAPEFWARAEKAVFLFLLLGGLFIPMYLAGKNHS